jgi:hypothetical protein
MHPEGQTAAELLEGRRNQQLCRYVWPRAVACGCLMCPAIGRRHDGTSKELTCACELSNSPCLHLTAESDSAEYTCAPDGLMPVPPCKYARFEYGGLPVPHSGVQEHNGGEVVLSVNWLVCGRKVCQEAASAGLRHEGPEWGNRRW